jgi:hypothetical protein
MNNGEDANERHNLILCGVNDIDIFPQTYQPQLSIYIVSSVSHAKSEGHIEESPM